MRDIYQGVLRIHSELVDLSSKYKATSETAERVKIRRAMMERAETMRDRIEDILLCNLKESTRAKWEEYSNGFRGYLDLLGHTEA